MLSKPKIFRGGYIFRGGEGLFTEKIENAFIPKKVTLPLKLRFGSHIVPLVKKGDQVRAGQIIARDDESISAPAIASVNGTVEDILQMDYFYGKVDAIVIKSDGTGESIRLEEATEEYKKLSFEKISELIYISGAASLGKSGIPTIFKSSPARPKTISNLIVTTFGTAPFALNDEIVFNSREKDFYHGLAILKQALPNAKVTIAIDKDNKRFSKKIIDAIRRGPTTAKIPDWIFIQQLEKKYPQESEDMLVRAILDKKIPIGGLGTDIGVLILDVHDLIRVYEAVAKGKPFIERTVAVAGSAVRENEYINLRIGVSIEEALKGKIKQDIPSRVIFGNCMTGLWEKNLTMPIGRSIGHVTVLRENKDRQFLAFLRPGVMSDSYSCAFASSCLPNNKIKYDTNLHGELRPCIQCGYCDEVCPVGIIPHLLSKHVEHDMCEGMERLGIFDCIDCGLCSYVCPCKIALADHIASGKRKLIEEGCNVPMVKVKESEEAVKAYRGRMPL